ncbi:ABC transporter permease [Gracilibacillus salinarum]|uniref:ABC transporter permease n=1 Tax=Gracilibacillus salinarum TaxID=2932255 RepID=A0ABY4GJG5_9BACI|nr:ABC transporter permease [Gracilibacillus salinarum]UOQ84344.1 ABC transporter permease [Gracilibacillus salinarum]
MNIMNKLTVRHLKKNKRRTLITIIGVIISVAMIMAVATLGVSFLDLMKRQTIATSGEWHVEYSEVNKEQVESIANDESTSKLVIKNDRGYAKLKGSENNNKPYLFIREYNAQGFKQFPIELSDGRLPQAANEVVISEEIINDAGVAYNIGEKLTLDIGRRIVEGWIDPLDQDNPLEKNKSGVVEELQVDEAETFTIVGMIERPIWEPAWSPGYTVINYVDRKLLTQQDSVDAMVVMDKVNGSLYEKTERLADQNNIETVKFHDDLLRYYGVTDNDNLRRTLYSLAAIIMAVIIIGSVSLIYNAFAISVSERAKHLGMLSSVGATKKQKRNSVFFEGAIIGGISIPIGIVAGLAGIAVTFLFINSFIEEALNVTEKLEVVVTPWSVVIACVVSIMTIFMSSYLPARKASKISAIDAIRQSQDIKLTRKAVKTSKLVRKIFGMEAEIGLKNLKRNKRRYQATVFSLVISIVLYLSVSFFTANISKSVELSLDDINYDIQVSGGTLEELESFTHLDGVTGANLQTQLQLTAPIKEEAWPEALRDEVEEQQLPLDNGKYDYNVSLYGLDSSSFQEYAEKIGADSENFLDMTKPTAIVIDKIKYQDFQEGRIIEANSINTTIGEKINLVYTNYESNEETSLPQMEIGALTDQVPMGITTSRIGGLDVIISQKTMDQLMTDQLEYPVDAHLYINSSDPVATQKAIENESSDMYVYNVYQQKQNQQQLILLMSVFTYGFIALISMISIANIFNTISTSISLRKREFAMLKSVGMTPKGFNKMINYESIFYGVKAVLYGLPISGAVMALMYWSLRSTFTYGFMIPWLNIIYVIAAIFLIVSFAMLYSIQKIKKENIIEGLIQENI